MDETRVLHDVITGRFFDQKNEARVPERIKQALDIWASGKQLRNTGGFLYKVLTNDLVGAVMAADEENLRALPAIVAYVRHTLPPESHGTPAKYEKWLSDHIR